MTTAETTVTQAATLPIEVEEDVLERLVDHIYRYRSIAFDSRQAGMTREEAERTAAILIRTKLIPTLNGGHVEHAFEIAQRQMHG